MRKPLQGTRNIVRFNRHFYLPAAVAAAADLWRVCLHRKLGGGLAGGHRCLCGKWNSFLSRK